MGSFIERARKLAEEGRPPVMIPATVGYENAAIAHIPPPGTTLDDTLEYCSLGRIRFISLEGKDRGYAQTITVSREDANSAWEAIQEVSRAGL